MPAIAFNLLMLLGGAPDWTTQPLDTVTIDAQAFVCTAGAGAPPGSSFYVLLQYDDARRLLDVTRGTGDSSEDAHLGDRVTSIAVRGDEGTGAWRLSAAGAASGHDVGIELTQQWKEGEFSTDMTVGWGPDRFKTKCMAVRLPSWFE